MAAGTTAPTLREKVLDALTQPASAKALATKLGLSTRLVRTELEVMGRQRLLYTKVLKSGDVIYRQPDAVDPAWDRHRPQLNFATN